MNTVRIKITFDDTINMTDAECTLLLAVVAAEGVFGSAHVRMDLCYEVRSEQREIVIHGDSFLGEIVALMYISLLINGLARMTLDTPGALCDVRRRDGNELLGLHVQLALGEDLPVERAERFVRLRHRLLSGSSVLGTHRRDCRMRADRHNGISNTTIGIIAGARLSRLWRDEHDPVSDAAQGVQPSCSYAVTIFLSATTNAAVRRSSIRSSSSITSFISRYAWRIVSSKPDRTMSSSSGPRRKRF